MRGGWQPVLLWTDAALWLVALAALAYAVHVWRSPLLRATWRQVAGDAGALCAALVLLLAFGVALADSVHGRSAADGRIRSLLDVALAEPLAMREASYSAPLAWAAFQKQTVLQDGRLERGFPRLDHGGRHLQAPERQWAADVATRCMAGAAGGAVGALLLLGAMGWVRARSHGTAVRQALSDLIRGHTQRPWRALWLTAAVLMVLAGMAATLSGAYHVLGTDRTGNDVLVQALKSLRTAFVIGIVSNLALLPFALSLGIVAGYLGGWVDDAILYLCTVLSSVPNVLLITASVLMVQVQLDSQVGATATGLERADLKMLLLCAILGTTGWAGLCRLLRAEVLKLRELDYVQAATAQGVGPLAVMWRHLLPNVMHLVLITTVLEFSGLVLYEAVLSYLGVGVDPALQSFGGMINLARSEMNRDPLVWWSFGAAFVFMLALVLAANLLADGVRQAFDPHAASFRPRRRPGGRAGPHHAAR